MSQWSSIQQLADDVQSGSMKATELVEKSLRTIADKANYQAIISTINERSRERAKNIDNSVKQGKKVGRLAGVPFIAKDNFLAFGAETTAASNILKGFHAPYQATAIDKLESEGAICVAKANLDAFAHGASTENSDFFVTKNPHDVSRVPGGSSGGSAAAVVLDMAPFTLGTDTGGSVRLPAAFTGCVGYKPTYGLISRNGIVAMASSTDVVGTLTRDVGDSALLIDVLAGRDELDSTTIERDPNKYGEQSEDLKGKTFGIVREYMQDTVDSGVRDNIQKAINKIERAGGKVILAEPIQSLPLALAAYYIICPAEVSSNLARYDGQRFGYTYKEATNLEESYNETRGHGFGKEAKRRILLGTYVLSSGYYDAYYKQAQIVRTKLINDFKAVFKKVDFLIGPTAPMTAFKIGENNKNPLQMYLVDIMTVAANLLGIPAISLPAGSVNSLPVGLQLMAPQHSDAALLSIAKSIEKVLI